MDRVSFEARYHGRCGSCGEHISPGDRVRYEGESVVHDDCDGVTAAATELDRDAKREVCTECWLLKPCDCEGT
ncbi:hypothetical protein [Agromyces ramosus]|uniref:Uncharacterized protein n=1 Tax=Agromyces ramosus TaxID=33879 RepID=A0ABU0R8Q7_9MICO|nr:hypothetical protein [Agromyces ramosus]MDQ0894450.1 hypothetical protein [Agromyces ramosus]